MFNYLTTKGHENPRAAGYCDPANCARHETPSLRISEHVNHGSEDIQFKIQVPCKLEASQKANTSHQIHSRVIFHLRSEPCSFVDCILRRYTGIIYVCASSVATQTHQCRHCEDHSIDTQSVTSHVLPGFV